MNPGTTIIILLGIIGLLLYASQALKVKTKEGFALVDEEQISSKSKEAMDDLKQGTLNFQSLLGAFSTPDLNTDPKAPTIGLGGPSISELVASKEKGPTNELMPSIKAPEPNPNSPLPPPPTTALPLSAPASLLTPPAPASTQTLSDSQGITLLKPAPPSAPPAAAAPSAPSVSSIAATAGSTKDKIEPMETIASSTTLASDTPVRTPLTRTRTKVRTKVVYVPRKCPTVDLSQYVRKDAIPCWGCNLK
jgi:hypothetical protein